MRRAFLSVLLSLLLSTPLHAQDTPFSAAQEAVLEKVATYFQNLKTLSSGFIQISSTGDYADGTVYLSRPDEKMRLLYNPPVQTELIVRNGTILYYDKEFEQVTYYPVNSTPLAALVNESLDFEKDVRVVNIAQAHGVIEVTLIDPDDEGMGSVSLIFSDKPFSFRKWHVIDAQGISTQVTLVNPKFNAPIDDTIFAFTAPDSES